MDTGDKPPDNNDTSASGKTGRVATPEAKSIAPAASFSSLACPHCGSLLDAPRINPQSGEPGRKCADCGRWQDGPSPFRRWHGAESSQPPEWA
jgi:hypothetical protein